MKFLLLSLCLFLVTPSWADDIFQATSEDIEEFDDLFDQPPQDKKPAKDKPTAREQFQGNKTKGPRRNQGNKRPRRGPPRDDRERGRKKPPPPPGGPHPLPPSP